MKGLLGFAALLALGMNGGVQAHPTPAPIAKTFTAAVPAATVTKLTLSFRVGQVMIKAGDTDTIRAKVRAEPGNTGSFIFKWVVGKGNGESLPPGLHLIHHRDKGTLTLCLAINKCGDFHSLGDGWKAAWDVTLPARLQVSLDGNVGKGTVEGVAGGLGINLNVGNLSMKLPCGPIKASLNVGNIEAHVADPDYGKVQLSTNVGHVDFSLGGNTVGKGLTRNFVSNSQSLQGSGTTAYTMSVNTGHIQLALGDKNIATNPTCHAPTSGTASAPASGSHAD